MISSWKKVDATEYVSSWRGQRLVLRWESNCWKLWVDGKLTNRSWPTPRQAWRDVDAIQQRVLRRLIKEARPAACPA
jgi:hypothetical protein